jgi:hypothetical protein
VLHSPLDSDGCTANALRRRGAPRTRIVAAAFGVAIAASSGCSSPPRETVEDPAVRREKLLDPQTCKECHLQHFQEWSASMHAYASVDPVFLAMNRRGQEETGGKLGSFCVNCHAPMALREGKTTDGLNLAELPAKLQGVTCYFCHNVAEVQGTHNNPIVLANDDAMRGSFIDPPPVTSPAHASRFSSFMLGSSEESALFCGSCHDIVLDTPAAPPPIGNEPVKLERTFGEWKESVFSFGEERANLPCATCHMALPAAPFKQEGPAAEKPGLQVGTRKLHEHLLAGVDVALTRFPDTGNLDEDTRLEAHHRARVQYLLNPSILVNEICVATVDAEHSRMRVTLENVGAGHKWPSGAAHDRRAWVEIKAYLDGQPTPVYQSGVVADGEDVTALADPDLWLIRDQLRGVGDKEPHMFWDVTDSQPATLPARTTNKLTDSDAFNNHRARDFPRAMSMAIPAPADWTRLRITVRVRIQPMGFDVLDDLVASGHLEPAIRARMPIFDVLPNVSNAQRLPQFREVSFEWSDEVRRSGLYLKSESAPAGVRTYCVGRLARP